MSNEFKIIGFGVPPSISNTTQPSSSGIKLSTILWLFGFGIAVTVGVYYLNLNNVSKNKQ